jgi:hypothetical protein
LPWNAPYDRQPKQLVLVDQIEPLILEIRGQKVIVDGELAAL